MRMAGSCVDQPRSMAAVPSSPKLVAGTPKRVNVCTSCLKAGKVTRAV